MNTPDYDGFVAKMKSAERKFMSVFLTNEHD